MMVDASSISYVQFVGFIIYILNVVTYINRQLVGTLPTTRPDSAGNLNHKWGRICEYLPRPLFMR